MALSCGCEAKAGMPVSRETLQAHYKHTFEALLFWELIYRKGEPANTEAKLKLSEARINLIDAIDELYPEAKED